MSSFKFTLLLTLLLGAWSSQAQIVGGEEETDTKEKKEKKKKEPREPINRDSLTGTTYYITGFSNYAYRTFADNTISGLHSEWEHIKPDVSGGGSFGVFLPVAKNLQLDIGFTCYGHKEQYTYVNHFTDSTFKYSNNYVHIGMPVKLRYTIGDKFQFFGFAGLTPLNVINIRYNQVYTDAAGGTYEADPEVIKDDKLAIFNVTANAGFGINWNFDWVGVTLYPEWRQGLFNTYNSQKGVTHRMYGLAVHAGFLLRF